MGERLGVDFRVGLASYCGNRPRNEDRGVALHCLSYASDVVLLGICDGMAEVANGERAAAELAASLCGFPGYVFPAVLDHSLAPGIEADMEAAIGRWYRDVVERLERVGREEHLTGLASTVVAAFMWADRMVFWWLGDSRAYLFRDGALKQLTVDHSCVVEDLGLSEDEALEHESRGMVKRFVKPGVSFTPDLAFHDWRDGDVVLLASDGVAQSCRTFELEAYLAYCLAARVDPDRLCRRVLEWAHRNLNDNATLAVSMRGTNKPFGEAFATLDPSIMVKRGLKAHVMEMLTVHPESTQEWHRRKRPGWYHDAARDASHGPAASELRLAGVGPASDEEVAVSVCLGCGRVLQGDDPCPEHNREQVWSGAYLEIVGPAGHVTYRAVGDGEEVLFTRRALEDGDVALEADEATSMDHARLALSRDTGARLVDLDSDNGTWIQIKELGWQGDEAGRGFTFRVGEHTVTAYPGRSQAGKEPAGGGSTATVTPLLSSPFRCAMVVRTHGCTRHPDGSG